MYTLKPGDNLKSSLEKNRFYRSKERVSVVPYATGEASKVINSHIEHLLFSKRDLLAKNSTICVPPKKSNLKTSAFIFHIPNSLYVLKSGLKKINQEPLFIEEEMAKKEVTKDITKASSLSSSASRRSLLLSTSLFYENFKGKQISNGTTAEISSKLSPGLFASFSFSEDQKIQYTVFTGIDFHIYNEKADQLFIANNNVQTLNFGVSFKLEHFKYFSPRMSLSLIEDLYYARQSSTTIGIEKELVTRVSLSTRMYFYRKDHFTISLEPTLIYDLEASPLKSGIGYHTPLAFDFSKGNYTWSIMADYLSTDKDLDDLELTRSTISTSLNMRLKF